jgi:5-methyltetrahydrofolate--homocysteine methyltransferase
MPDIHLRFHHDMLVFSAPINGSLAKQGFEDPEELELLCLTEPESVKEALRLEHLAGAQCLVAPAPGVTQARLAHSRLEDHAAEAAASALEMAQWFHPQHVIAPIDATRLPLDPTSKDSLMANRNQYSEAVRAYGDDGVDAFLLDGLASADDVRCALMGARRVTDLPLFVSVDVDGEGNLASPKAPVEDLLDIMVECEASAVGIRTAAAPEAAAAVVQRIAKAIDLPILVQLAVKPEESRLPRHMHESPYWHPDTMMQATAVLRAAGAQFLRAVGEPTPTYTGALVASTMGAACLR